MDKLIKFTDDHNKISEMMAMYKEIMKNVNLYDPLEFADNLNKMFRETILPHFEFEEQEVFPPILFGADSSLYATVVKLQNDHKLMRDKLSRINELKARLASGPDAREKEKLAALCNELTRNLSDHALKEDTVIFPSLKKDDPGVK